MELLNLTKDDIFKKKDIDNSNKIDFYESYSDTGIYNKEAYLQDRPIYNEFIKDYNIEPVNNNFNQMIHERKVREEREIVENLAEISITPDPRITKYEDTYSLTPYATYILTPLSDIDGEDIVSRFDSCYGEWVTRHQDRCDINTEPCKRIKQHFKIHNPGYTGEHCRDDDGRRLRRGDTKHVFCNHYQNPKCNGHGECIRNNSSNTCVCKDGYSGPNCENTLPPAEQFKYNCCSTTGSCIQDISGIYSDMHVCNSECNKLNIVCPRDFCNNHGAINGGNDIACSCTCSASYIGKYCKYNKGEDLKCKKFCYAGFIPHQIKGPNASLDVCKQITDIDKCNNAYADQYENNIGKGCVWSGSDTDGVCGIKGVNTFYDTSNCPTTCCNGNSGPNCENVITCKSNDECLNGGTCVNGKCNCSSGWYGVNCNNGDRYRCNTNSDCNDDNTCELDNGLNLKCCTKGKQTALSCEADANPSENCPGDIRCDNTLCKNERCCCPPQ